VIHAEKLAKRFGAQLALAGIDLEVQKGERVGLLGPNGAGKTTLMRLCAGYLARDAGALTVDGLDPDEEGLELKRRIGYLPESAPLHPEMTVEGWLDHRARLKDVADRRSRIAKVMEEVGVGDARRRLVGQLSKGYRQRVGLADLLLHDPRLVILDEPTAGLDPQQIQLALASFARLGAERTLLYSSHVLPEVEAVASRVVILVGGKIVADGQTSAAGTTLRVHPEDEEKALAALPEAEKGPTGTLTTALAAEEAAKRLVEAGVRLVELRRRSLDEIYAAAIG
jgi:ABC-2 type transport system ATP-binding protein